MDEKHSDKAKPRKRKPSAKKEKKEKPAKKQKADKSEKKSFREPSSIPVAELKVGNYLSVTEYYRVKSVNPDTGEFTVDNLRSGKLGDVWTIQCTSHPFFADSASRFSKTERVSKTRMAEIFSQIKNEVFTVTFNTVFDEKRLAEELQANPPTECKTAADFKALSEKMMANKERTLIGRILDMKSLMGYALVDDLEIASKTPGQPQFRNINLRDLRELIVNGVKYVVN